jgi:hypothetical protein
METENPDSHIPSGCTQAEYELSEGDNKSLLKIGGKNYKRP